MQDNQIFLKLGLSQLQSLEKQHTGTSLVDLKLAIADKLVNSKIEEAKKYYFAANQYATKLNYNKGIATSDFGLGDVFRIKNDYGHARFHYLKSLNHFKQLENLIQQGRCIRRLGDVYYHIHELKKSLEYYLSALEIFKKLTLNKNSSYEIVQVAHLLATIGNVLKHTGDIDSAMRYYKRCHLIYTEQEFKNGIPGILLNIGDILELQNKNIAALDLYKEALDASEDHYLTSIALNRLGSVFLKLQEFEKAEEFFSRSREISLTNERRRGVLAAILKLIELNRLISNHDKALALSTTAANLAEELNDRNSSVAILKEKTLLLKAKHQYKSALEASLAHQKLKEELLSEKRLLELDHMKMLYEAEAKEHKIEQLRKEGNSNKKIIDVTLMGLAFLGASLVLVYRSAYYRKKTNKALKEAYSQVEKISKSDALTGLANRRDILECLCNEKNRSSRNGRIFSIIMSDIDFFKQVNDRFGHGHGDQILMQISKLLTESFRKQDIIARWGGEEFLLLLPETRMKNAINAAEKARILIENTIFRHNKVSLRLTMTFGVSEGNGSRSIDEMIQSADSALYKGKNSGRNNVSFIT